MHKNVKVNDDLQRERNKCDFNVEELTNYWDGGAKLTKKRRDFEEKVYSIKGIKDEALEEYLSHKDKYENAIRKAVLLYEALKDLHDPSQTDKEKYREGFRNQVMAGVFKDNSPFGLHTAMFIPTLVSQADDEQKEKWLKRAYNYEIIGTYAQTEMGHGTFIRGLETTATYDPQTEEFVLHSPTLTSHKWWPGNLAHTANYAVVMAQLYIKGKNHGIQPFIVQLRDEDTHMPLPGINIGEIGPKLGYNTVNNGFLGFNQYRIPRRQMLMKNVQVLKDGTFKESSNIKLVYGTMVFVRVMIVNDSSNKLSRAVAIAVRYSAVRKQSKPKPNEPEPQVLDYATQQHKLFICIATCHAYWTTVRWLWDLYTDVTTDMNAGKLDRLPELHSLACCLKVVSSADCAGMIERCRLACGGHGYLASSNLPQLYGIATAACSYEGENTVLLLQTARSLAKAWNQASKGETLAPTMAYISDRTLLKQWDSSVDGIIEASQKVAAGKLSTSMASLESYRKSGMSSEDAWNKASVQLVAAAEAHGRSVVLSVFSSEMKRSTSSLSAPVQRVLNQLVEMYACYWTLEKLGDFALYTPITQQDVQFIQRKYEDLLEAVRPNAVGLVDAFDYRDELLNSTLGSYDGRVYERLMEEALKSPLNKEPVNQSFHKYLKPFMQKAKI